MCSTDRPFHAAERHVNSIRQTIQYYSDISTIPWIMNPYHHRPAPDAHTTHVRRDFEKLQNWARERAFAQEEYDILLAANPYPQGQGCKLLFGV